MSKPPKVENRIRELLKNVKPGPWSIPYGEFNQTRADAELIVALRNAAPEIADLLDACKAVQECAIDDEYTPRMWKARDELEKKLGRGDEE